MHEETTHSIHISRVICRKVTSSHVYRVRKGGQEFFLALRQYARPGQSPHPKIRVTIRHGYSQGSETKRTGQREARNGTMWAPIPNTTIHHSHTQARNAVMVKSDATCRPAGSKMQSGGDVTIKPHQGVNAKCRYPRDWGRSNVNQRRNTSSPHWGK